MFRKINIKALLVIFCILLAVVIIWQVLSSQRKERTYREYAAMVDTAKITSILLYPRAAEFREVQLVKSAGVWQVTGEKGTFTADMNAVASMLNELTKMKTERMAANSEEKWQQYEVVDTIGTRVKVLENEKVTADIIIGKFSYRQPANPYERQGKMTTYVRVTGENEVYAVDGFLSMTFNREANQLINRNIINSDQNNWTQLVFNYPADSSFTMTGQDGKWLVQGAPADSAKVAQYFSKIAHLTGNVLENAEPYKQMQPVMSVRIEGNNVNPVQVSAYPADSITKYAVSSSQNLGVYFNGGQGELIKKLFVSPGSFFKAETQE